MVIVSPGHSSPVTRRRANRASHGFTLIELMITVAIVAILASAALPLTQITVQRAKEQELRASLRQIREAIDAYKQAADEGRVSRKADESGYPPELGALASGVADIKSPEKKMIYFLRRVPRDPIAPPELTAVETWGKRSYASPPDDPRDGEDVFDVYSMADGVGLNGVPYREW
jgi:general secretion pathway protein G